MKQILLFLLIIASSITFTFAQQSTPTPAPTPVPITTPVYKPSLSEMNRQGYPLDGRVNLTQSQAIALRQLLVQKYAQPLYRKPTNSELEILAPDADVVSKYKEFLGKKNKGIFKLVADAGCSGNSKVVVATEECLKYTMPGSGNSYSFRIGNYRIRHLSDLMLANGHFQIPGILMHGMMTKLGNFPIESVSLQTNGLEFLKEFKPSDDFESAMAIEKIAMMGLERDGFTYSRSLLVEENATYAIRVVAYDGTVMRAVPGASYNEMDFDRRRDITVVFRVVKKDPDGSATVVWTELSDVDAPKLKLPEKGSDLDNVKK